MADWQVGDIEVTSVLEQVAEFPARFRVLEILFVLLDRQGQRHHQFDAPGPGDASGDAIAAVGERTDQPQRGIRVAFFQGLEQGLDLGFDDRDFVIRRIAVGGHAESQWDLSGDRPGGIGVVGIYRHPALLDPNRTPP